MTFASPTAIEAEVPLTAMSPSTAGEAIGPAPKFVCGLSDTTDLEREQHIQDCGHRMELAMQLGDRKQAREWMDLQHQAIKARSEAQKARMERVIDDGLDYFSTEGQRARRMLDARGLA
jgi:hypothetical protein